jgi:hypothetical protein
MSAKRFKWADYQFVEVIENGSRKVILQLSPQEEFEAVSDGFLREEAAAAILKQPEVQVRLKRKSTVIPLAKAAETH